MTRIILLATAIALGFATAPLRADTWPTTPSHPARSALYDPAPCPPQPLPTGDETGY